MRRYTNFIPLLGLILLCLYLFVYHPEVKAGDKWGFYKNEDNPFAKPDSVFWQIDEVKDGWVKYHYISDRKPYTYFYKDDLYLYKSWTKF